MTAIAGTAAHAAAASTNPQCFAYMSAGSPNLIINHATALQWSQCAGLSWVFPWNKRETAAGVYKWSSVDEALAASGTKPVFHRVIARQRLAVVAESRRRHRLGQRQGQHRVGADPVEHRLPCAVEGLHHRIRRPV